MSGEETIEQIEKRRAEEAERAALALSDRAVTAEKELYRLSVEHDGLPHVSFVFRVGAKGFVRCVYIYRGCI